MAEGSAAAKSSAEEGFTLIEILVALAVLAVASAGLIGAAERHVEAIRALQSRAAAQWVAENRIAELNAGVEAAPKSFDREEMLGRLWVVQVPRRPTDDPDLDAMRISVSAEGETEPLVSMDFFRDRQRSSGS